MMEMILSVIISNGVIAGLIIALWKSQTKRIDAHDTDIKDLYEKSNTNQKNIATLLERTSN